MAPKQQLGNKTQDQLIEQLLQRLAEAGFFLPSDVYFPTEQFYKLRKSVRSTFTVPETSITPLMARLFFALAVMRKPTHIVGLGTYAGNALVWLAGSSLIDDPLFHTNTIVGCDIDPTATQLAQQNFRTLSNSEKIQLVCVDGHAWLEENQTPIDLLYIDVDSHDGRKKAYLSLIELALPQLEPGALVLAHDVTVTKFADDLAPYLAFVKNTHHFRFSATLNIDSCGLEVSLR